MIIFQKTKKFLLIVLAFSALTVSCTAPAGILDSFAKWWKGNYQKNTTLTVLSTCIVGFGAAWAFSKIYNYFNSKKAFLKSQNYIIHKLLNP